MGRGMLVQGLLVLLCVLAAGGCTTVQYVPVPDRARPVSDPSMARVYMYRLYAYPGCANSLIIKDNDQPVGKLAVSRYLCWDRPAGEALIYAGFPPDMFGLVAASQVILTAERGQTYYLSVQCGVTPRPTIRLLDEAAGRALVGKVLAPVYEAGYEEMATPGESGLESAVSGPRGRGPSMAEYGGTPSPASAEPQGQMTAPPDERF